MTLYQILDFVADSYNPIALAVLLAVIIKEYQITSKAKGMISAVSLLSGLFIVYGIQWIDKAFGIWSRFGLDYSTHTAFSICIITLSVSLRVRGREIILLSLAGYLLLMLYQGYHTLMDIAATGIVIFPLLIVLLLSGRRVQDKLCDTVEK